MEEYNIFDAWNNEKKNIHVANNATDFFIKPREIWFTKMGKNIGYEENGKKEFTRPVLVLKKVGNLFFTVALTTKGKEENKFHYKFVQAHFTGEHKDHEDSSFVILSQARVMDKKRFQEKIGYIGTEEFEIIKQKITTLLL